MSLSNPTGETVLVTGGSGYLAGWIIGELLSRGYSVRTTVRSLSREDDVRRAVAERVDASDRLSFVAADLMRDAGWEEATAGAAYVMHTASPMPAGEFKGQDMIAPAREGVRRVLTAAIAARVRRVVMTSSVEAARASSPDIPATEVDWSDLPDKPAYNYGRSKTLAEQDAWALARAPGVATELTTVLPAFIQGPVFGADYSGSVEVVTRLLSGQMPAMPRIGFSIVDVRDLVDLHLLAMTRPEAAGQRFIASSGFLWLEEIAALLRNTLGDAASKVPTKTVPDVVVRGLALVNPDMAFVAPNLGVRRVLDAGKAKSVLGWTGRDPAESILDGARSLIARGLVH